MRELKSTEIVERLLKNKEKIKSLTNNVGGVVFPVIVGVQSPGHHLTLVQTDCRVRNSWEVTISLSSCKFSQNKFDFQKRQQISLQRTDCLKIQHLKLTKAEREGPD